MFCPSNRNFLLALYYGRKLLFLMHFNARVSWVARWLLTTFCCGVVCARAHAEDRWLRFLTPHVEVFTDAGAGKGKEVLRRFEQIRQVLLKTATTQPKSGLPIRIFVFRTEKEFAEYKDARRKSMAGFYQAGRDRDYIVMQNSGPDIYRIVFHEYVHVVMRHAGAPVPLWLNEGTAELFSTVETTSSQIKLGEVIPAHIFTLRHEKLIDLPALMAVDHDSPLYNEQNKVGMFYAESWALVHMLNMHPPYSRGRSKLLGLVLAGAPPAQAFEQTYSKSTEQVLEDLRDYVYGNRFMGTMVKTDPLEALDDLAPDELAPSESGLALADLLINLAKARDAEPKLRKLAQENPNAAGIEAGLGDTALARHRNDEALAHYQRAIDLGGTNARIYFEKADLERGNEADLKQTLLDLQRAVEIDPDFWQARHLLGHLYLRGHQYPQAIEQLREAAQLAPRNVNVWENLALARFYAGDKAGALMAAKQGRAVAKKPNEIDAMEATLREIQTPSTEFENHSSKDVPKSWLNRQGNQRIEGKLVQLDCLGTAAVFHVIAGTQTLALYVANPRKVVLTKAPGRSVELTCGTFPPRDAVIEYIATPDAQKKTAGEITALEFK